ncbi:MAG TPA: class I SAM-dependent rRNA methyltransferase [Geminicoccaceae bacterium]|nr:class I SAM-dependent rRNA methyltransferase [Geminicoccaceae bacterium]
MTLPKLHLLSGQDRRLRAGHPWVFANEVRMDDAARALPPGGLVRVIDARDQFVGLAHANPHSLIVARVLTRQRQATVDRAFLERRLTRALQIRERLYGAPFYRLVHAEADGLPGLVIDRFGDVLVAQLNTAGMSRMEEPLLDALRELLAPRAVVLRNDSPARTLEGLTSEVRIARGTLEPPLEIVENGVTFLVDPLQGQKTGWYYDQAENRAFAARLVAEGQRVLDLYGYGGGFALAALGAGARDALVVDRSEASLDLAARSAERNGFADRCELRRAEGFAAIEELTEGRRHFGLVVADPPSFVKSRKDLNQGLRGYRKLARGAAALVAEGGFLVIACCSHHVGAAAFADEVRRGLRDAGRPARLLRQSGAGPDHPTHPALPESAYLKCLFYALD